MKRTNLFTISILSAALIFWGMTSCHINVNGQGVKYTDYTVTVTYVTSTAQYTDIAENVVKVYANYSDNSVVKVSSTDYTVSTENVSELVTGKNTISVTYKNVTKQVEVWKASQTMTENPELLSDYTGTRGASSNTIKYYQFGDYPQTPVADQDSIPALSPDKAPNGYQIGQDGNYYIYNEGDEKYYSPEPIVWCAVSDSFDYDGHFEDSTASDACTNKGVLLVAESILDGDIAYYDDAVSTPYNVTASTAEEALAVLLAKEEGHLRTVNEKTIYPNNYANSKIRAYLNGLSYVSADGSSESSYLNEGFLQMAFSEKVQSETLLETTVLNDGTSGTDTKNASLQPIDGTGSCAIDLTCENTQDKVFLLSEYESNSEDLGYTSGNINSEPDETKKTATNYATGKGSENTWFTRTPYYKNGCSVRVIINTGYQYPNTLVTKTTYGVVPAIVLPSSAF